MCPSNGEDIAVVCQENSFPVLLHAQAHLIVGGLVVCGTRWALRGLRKGWGCYGCQQGAPPHGCAWWLYLSSPCLCCWYRSGSALQPQMQASADALASGFFTHRHPLIRCNTGLVYVQLLISMLEPHSPAQTQCLAQILPFNRIVLTHAHTFGVPYLWLSDKAGQHALLPIAKHVQLWIEWGQLQLNKGKSSICVLDHRLQHSLMRTVIYR